MLKGLKNFMGIGEEEYYEEDIYEEEIEEAKRTLESSTESKNSFTAPRNDVKTNREIKKNPDGTRTLTGTTGLKMIIIEPVSTDECEKLADNLKAKKSIIINLSKAEGKVAHKIYNFLLGVIYALDGSVSKIDSNIFAFVPKHVDISDKRMTEEIKSRQKSLWG